MPRTGKSRVEERVAGLQKTVDDLQAAQKKTMEDQKKTDTLPAKGMRQAPQGMRRRT